MLSNIIIIIILFLVVLVVSIANGLIEISIENKSGKDCSNSFTIGVMSGLLSAVIIAIPFLIIIDKKTPSAIDVYRNKTELKVKYVIENNDTIQSDTTVVFKNI
jgi:preprotein translocase subunit SecF